jgi:heme o synthase
LTSSLTFRETIGAYLELTKLRIVTLLVFTTVTAMIAAADGIPALDVLTLTILGGALASAGSSAINQYYDRDMDALMARTARRPIPSGRIRPINALVYGLALIVLSVVILGFGVNWLAAGLAFGGAVYYVIIYTVLLKRNTFWNIIIGGGAGAMPVLVGWAAVTGMLSLDALILFAIVFFWTPPHSWALALLVNKDYTRANVPMMPVAKGEDVTRQQMIGYSIVLLLVSLLAIITFSWLYIAAALLLGVRLIYMTIRLRAEKTPQITRATYKFSTAYLALLFLAMILDTLLL